MELLFDFDSHQGIINVHFHGLDGTEPVTSIKEALNLLKIRNPAKTFSEAVRNGAYNDVPDAEYKRMLETIKYISSMWCYMDEPGEAPQKGEMNALMLLANAIEALSQFNVLYQMPPDEDPTTT
ncbi:MAG: hypothetical protein K2O11_11565 [Oscillospiraceae bacterium]|nr:hypothetical protein [Oscillospiraceae bacterium]